MPPQLLFDISQIDLSRVIHGIEEIRKYNKQRGDMEHLDGIVHVDVPHGRCIGYKDVGADEFWVAGHIPGRPLFPGVLMIEAAAQLASFYEARFGALTGFMGFGGVDEVKFRQPVLPGNRLHILFQHISHRHGRIHCRAQGVVNGKLAFEALIMGTKM